jgi:cytochrome P450
MKAGVCPFNHGEVEGIESFDMLDPVARSNPFPYYHWLQQSEDRRVYEIPDEQGFYAVHRYEDVKWVLQNPTLFANDILPTSKSPFFALMDGEEHARIRNVAAKIFLKKDEKLEDLIEKSIKQYTSEIRDSVEVEVFSEWATPIAISTRNS